MINNAENLSPPVRLIPLYIRATLIPRFVLQWVKIVASQSIIKSVETVHHWWQSPFFCCCKYPFLAQFACLKEELFEAFLMRNFLRENSHAKCFCLGLFIAVPISIYTIKSIKHSYRQMFTYFTPLGYLHYSQIRLWVLLKLYGTT